VAKTAKVMGTQAHPAAGVAVGVAVDLVVERGLLAG